MTVPRGVAAIKLDDDDVTTLPRGQPAVGDIGAAMVRSVKPLPPRS